MGFKLTLPLYNKTWDSKYCIIHTKCFASSVNKFD